MRKQFIKTTEEVLEKDPRAVLLLGDIGVFGFRNAFQKYPSRVYNIGILEQATISTASGLAMTGMIPIVHTIAPFITERCFEQIKNDFGYQKLGGNLISVGASYDYAGLGCTHHCPADIPILMNIPGVEIVVPGNTEEFDTLFKSAYADSKLTYFRLSEQKNQYKVPVKFGKANIIKKGKLGTVIAVGPMLDRTVEAAKNFDVTVIYLSTLRPFDSTTVRKNITGDKILVVEPYYQGALATDILSAAKHLVSIEFAGIPKEFLTEYGTVEDHDKKLGLTEKGIFNRIKKMIHG